MQYFLDVFWHPMTLELQIGTPVNDMPRILVCLKPSRFRVKSLYMGQRGEWTGKTHNAVNGTYGRAVNKLK